jgi:hypothetical protein
MAGTQIQAMWEAAYRHNDKAHWLVLSDYLEELGLPAVAAAMRQAVEASPPGDGLSREEQLPLAAEAGQCPIVRKILEQGVVHYNHAQRAAARAGQDEALLLLLEDAVRIRGEKRWVHHEKPGPMDGYSYDWAMLDRRPETEPVHEPEALVDAGEAGHRSTLELFLKYTGPAGRGGAIRGAARGGHQSIVEWLLEAGAPLGEALSGAVYAGPRTMIEFLLDRGAEPSELICALAAALRDMEIVELLLQHGGSPNWGLSDAAEHGRKDVVEFLLRQGAKPDARNLRAAIHNGHSDIAELLQRHGATPDPETTEVKSS